MICVSVIGAQEAEKSYHGAQTGEGLNRAKKGRGGPPGVNRKPRSDSDSSSELSFGFSGFRFFGRHTWSFAGGLRFQNLHTAGDFLAVLLIVVDDDFGVLGQVALHLGFGSARKSPLTLLLSHRLGDHQAGVGRRHKLAGGLVGLSFFRSFGGRRSCFARGLCRRRSLRRPASTGKTATPSDRKSTRLNSSHVAISYAVFCLKKKNNYARYSSR